MKKYLNVLSALILGAFCLLFVGTASAQLESTANAKVPQVISKEEAAQKYPPPNGKSYPAAVYVPTNTGGFYRSPYSNQIYDCRKNSCPQCVMGVSLILDTTANKVFQLRIQ
jgi:hypothetical protein